MGRVVGEEAMLTNNDNDTMMPRESGGGEYILGCSYKKKCLFASIVGICIKACTLQFCEFP